MYIPSQLGTIAAICRIVYVLHVFPSGLSCIARLYHFRTGSVNRACLLNATYHFDFEDLFASKRSKKGNETENECKDFKDFEVDAKSSVEGSLSYISSIYMHILRDCIYLHLR